METREPFRLPVPDVLLAHVAFRAAVYTPANKPVTYVRSERPISRRGVRAYLSDDRDWIVLVDVGGEFPNRHVPISTVSGIVFDAEVQRHAATKVRGKAADEGAGAPAAASA